MSLNIFSALKCTAIFCLFAIQVSLAPAKDYFLVIGGGYSPQGNQASLEANVLFFQQLLRDQTAGESEPVVFFADGDRNTADLQVLRTQPESESSSPVTDLLNSLYSYRSRPEVTYRNHEVPDVAGPNKPSNIKDALQSVGRKMSSGDRLIVYVTAHGGSAKGRNKYDTTISCWDNQSIKASVFASWLDELPSEVPVIMVMAQCYCGGFAHTIFDKADQDIGLAEHVRVGFYAQQHDLAAAGCRPDIENDEEYSSFFWGAFLGRSRSGKALEHVDLDADGAISFAEAHVCALLASNTIDIPLRATEALLRTYSRIVDYEHRGQIVPKAVTKNVPADELSDEHPLSGDVLSELLPMAGSLRDLCRATRADLRQTVAGLAGQLDISLDDSVTIVFDKFEALKDQNRNLNRDLSRGRRSRGSGRRELREDIAHQWPELGDRERWRESEMLASGRQVSLIDEIKSLPTYRVYAEKREQSEAASDAREQRELKEVKYQRLINTLEIICLAENLPKIADPSVVDRYNEMLTIEESSLNTR